MSVRVCPKCKSILGNNEYYFCASCANPLDANLVRQPVITQITRYIPQSSGKSFFSGMISQQIQKHLGFILDNQDLKRSLILIVAGISVLINIVLIYRSNSQSVRINRIIMENNVAAVPNTLQFGYTWPSKIFNTHSLLDFVPKDAELYIEGHSYKDFSNTYLNTTEEAVYLKLFNLLLDDPFVIYALRNEGNLEWGAVTLLKETDGVDKKIIELLEGFEGSFKHKVIEDKLLMATNDALIEQSESAGQKKETNLGLNQKYATAKAVLPREGHLLIMFFNDDIKKDLSNIVEKYGSDRAKQDLEIILSTGYNELVIQ